MAGLLDYITNAMSGGQPTQQEMEAILQMQQRAREEQDMMRMLIEAKRVSPSGAGMMSEKEGAAMRNITMPPTSNMGQMTDLEALRMQSLKNALPYSLSRPSGAYQYPQNTMQKIDPMIGGMTARNAQPPMDLNMLLRLLGR
jgi:hypothetical protein